jgi:hypothetical protein
MILDIAMSTEDRLILSAAGAFVEAVAGFGGTVLALSLGARWFGIEALLAWFLPLNLGCRRRSRCADGA